MGPKESSLRMWSVGIVAENKALDSPLVEVLPVEALNLMDQELGTGLTPVESSGVDVDGQQYTIKIDMGASLKAEWLGETNRLTPPDVRRGEQVWIWRQGDADKYYWTSMGRDDDLRRLETVIYRYSGLPENVDEPIDVDNSYYLEVSTHDKIITLKTSQRNGEFCRYLCQINTGDGQITIEDDLGNIIQMDSARTNIYIRNADNSFVELNKTHINVQSDESISMATRDFRIRCQDFSLKTTGNCEFIANGWLQQISRGRQLIKSNRSLVLTGPRRTIVL